MKKFIVTSAMTLMLSMSLSAATGDGAWYKPFNPRVFHSIYDVMSTGTTIWFLTESGVGQLNTVTKESGFFSYSSIGRAHYPFGGFYHLAGGDSTHVVLWNSDFSGDSDKIVLYLYDGISWKETVSPYPTILGKGISVYADNRGHVWEFQYSHQITRYDGSEWKLLLENSGTGAFPDRSYMADDTGLWIGYTEISAGAVTVTARIYRFDGSQSQPMLSIPGEYAADIRISKDINGTTWIYGYSTGLYKVGADQTLTLYPKGPASTWGFKPDSFGWADLIVGPDGAFWSIAPDLENIGKAYLLTAELDSAESLDSVQPFQVDSVTLGSQAVACKNGVYVNEAGKNGFRYYAKNGRDYSFIPIGSGGDACGNLDEALTTFFRKDNSIVSVIGGIGHINLIAYENNKCRELPAFGQQNDIVLFEQPDGTLLTYGQNFPGVYALRGSTWELLPGTENFYCLNMMADRSGRIWGTTGTGIDNVKIVRQTGSDWEIIDSGNSNFPYYLDSLNEGDIEDVFEVLPALPFLESADGSIWAQVGTSVAKTRDGYHWTVFNSKYSNLPAGHIAQMLTDRAGNITLLGFADCRNSSIWYSDTCSTIFRAVYNGNGWTIETIPVPMSLTASYPVFQDSKGDIWINAVRYGYDDVPLTYRHCIYRYSGSSWIRYDSLNTSFSLLDYIGEDATGKMYFSDTYNETVLFDRDGIGTSPVKKHAAPKPMPLHCRASGGDILVDYTLSHPGEATLSLCTLQGRLVKTITAGRRAEGTHHGIFSVNCAPGIYFVRLSAPGGSQTARMIVK